ncbi:MAG: hypothetical protein ABIY55_03850, partial [Kofleriaceae bacterium]
RTAATQRWILLIERGMSLDALPGVAAHLAQFRALLEPRAIAAPAGPGRKPGPYRWHELQDPVGALVKSRAPRLLYQDIQTGPVCCLDRDGALVPDTTVWMLPSQDLYLLAVLSSPLYGWYARRRFPPALNGSVRPKAQYLRQLPVATPSPELRAVIEALVAQRIALAAPGADHDDDHAERARVLDAAIGDAVLEAYELTAAERARIATPG